MFLEILYIFFAGKFGYSKKTYYLCISFKDRIAGWSSGSSLGS